MLQFHRFIGKVLGGVQHGHYIADKNPKGNPKDPIY